MTFHDQYKQFTDEELMKFIQQNDHRAFNELYDRYSKRILHFMFKMLDYSKDKAQDLLQDLFLKIAEHPELFDTNKKFYTWVFTVAANMCRTVHRNKKIQNTHNNEIGINNASQKNDESNGMDDALFNTQLGLALEKLSYEQKETFTLRFREEFSLKEISEIMNCSEGTVKSRIFHITKKLAEELKEFEPLLKK